MQTGVVGLVAAVHNWPDRWTLTGREEGRKQKVSSSSTTSTVEEVAESIVEKPAEDEITNKIKFAGGFKLRCERLLTM